MWCRSYRDHAIMAFPSFDTVSKLWACQANITWVVGSSRESSFVRFSRRAANEADAAALALSAAQEWIDNRLKELRMFPTWQAPAQSVGLSSDLRRAKEYAARHSKSSKAPSRTLTYDQFKILMGDSGRRGSERLLQKSYAALLQLRRSSHRSWREITVKIRHPHTVSVGEIQPSRLPLTARDWRRIV
jgi:hypothetical protein